MLSLTLDTNCLIDLDEQRPVAQFVERLRSLWKDGKIDLAVVASSASERQRAGDYLQSFSAFESRVAGLGFDGVAILPSLAKWGVSFWRNAVWASEEDAALERRIFELMFPNAHYDWQQLAFSIGIDPEDRTSVPYMKWRNKMLDAQAFWAHMNAGRDIFVTSDAEFGKLRVEEFNFPAIMTPEEAVKAVET